ncbi:VanZ family protein [Microbacterium sp. 4R-513]|uniref:VanZ family protein n=1 Tax=Microbacterium sp. 4R-513 TaxID=2567934 RepID=UPI0013E103B2|nr:VanZ family protein [Microbacterium sp. 4R-513]QIG39902.1 VanZ family protein [Microbacterium sp. 4R-513]
MTASATSAPLTPASRLWTAVAALSALGVVSALTLAPRSVVAPARALFERVTDAAAAPLLDALPYADPDRVLNTLLFIPLGATLALLLGRRSWPLAIVAGFALSAAVEYAQATIPGRVPDPDDVVWNTTGAAAGAVAVGILLLGAALARGIARAVRRSGA